jgi:hypothetical protein
LYVGRAAPASRASRHELGAQPPIPCANQVAGDGDKSNELRPTLDLSFFADVIHFLLAEFTFCLPNKA